VFCVLPACYLSLSPLLSPNTHSNNDWVSTAGFVISAVGNVGRRKGGIEVEGEPGKKKKKCTCEVFLFAFGL
jgi:hypothetical protein